MYLLLASISAALLLHLLALAVTAKLCGVNIVEFKFGIGPKICDVSKVSVRLIPIAGYVKMIDSRESALKKGEERYAYDHKPKLIRVLIALSGCVFLFTAAFIFLGKEAIHIFIGSFSNLLTGAFSPFGSAQEYIESTRTFILSSTPIVVFSATAIYVSAYNLFPLPALNGGHALLEIVDLSDEIKRRLSVLGFFANLLMLLSWLSALAAYMWL